ncbi:hypothetical protein RZE82_07870 [Mollicutes bacterium LVI A0039]|nr:hypothetical protein RZE82_07870 [Mollicutes bacterium LVI A0039]
MISIPKELKKEINIKGIKFKHIVFVLLPFLVISNLESLNIINRYSFTSKVLITFFALLLFMPFNTKPLIETIIHNIVYIFEKKHYFKNRDSFIDNKFHYIPKEYEGRNIIKKAYFMQVNILNMWILNIKRSVYLMLHRRDIDIDQSILMQVNYEKINGHVLFTVGSVKYLVKKIELNHSKFFNNRDETELFYSYYYSFLLQNPEINIYKFHSYPNDSKVKVELQNVHSNYISDLISSWNYKKEWDYLNTTMPYFYTVELYNEKKRYQNKNFHILQHVDISTEDISLLNIHLFNNVVNINSLQFDEEMAQLDSDFGTNYIKFFTIDDLEINQDYLYIEKLLTKSYVSAKIFFEHCETSKIKDTIDKSAREALSRINDTEKISVMGLERNEMDKLIEYSNLLNDNSDIIIRFKMTIRIVTTSKEEMKQISEKLYEENSNLRIQSDIFTQQEQFKKWNMIKKEY